MRSTSTRAVASRDRQNWMRSDAVSDPLGEPVDVDTFPVELDEDRLELAQCFGVR